MILSFGMTSKSSGGCNRSCRASFVISDVLLLSLICACSHAWTVAPLGVKVLKLFIKICLLL